MIADELIQAEYIGGPIDGHHVFVTDDDRLIEVEDEAGVYVRTGKYRLFWLSDSEAQSPPQCSWYRRK